MDNVGFPHALALWANFFGATAQVSGALVGLVFVALTFNHAALGAQGDPLLQLLARQTYGDFVKALGVSLVMLVPYNSPMGLAFTLLVFALIDSIQLARRTVAARRRGTRAAAGEVYRRLLLTALANVALIASAITFVLFPAGALPWELLVNAMLLLIIAGCRSAWLLVVTERLP